MAHLTAVIITFNESKHIQACIASLDFADHVLVFDSYSHDDTVLLATQSGAEVVKREFDNFASQRNAAIQAVADRTDWILFVDADERITEALAQEIRQAIAQHPEYAGWRIPRHNYIFGKLTRGAGWFPDYQTRLLRANHAHYDPDKKVHEVVILDGDEGTLAEPIIHYNYETVAQFHATQRKYTRYEAQILHDQGIKPKTQNYVLQPLRQFRWRYITLKGYKDGFHGLRLCMYMSWYEFRKYVILRGIWKEKEATQ